jgi:hypothetical protein
MRTEIEEIYNIPLMHVPQVPETLAMIFGGCTPLMTKHVVVPKAAAKHLNAFRFRSTS